MYDEHNTVPSIVCILLLLIIEIPVFHTIYIMKDRLPDLGTELDIRIIDTEVRWSPILYFDVMDQYKYIQV